jgi:hypothetical protein
MNMTDRPFAWQGQKQAQQLSNTIAPLGGGGEQAPGTLHVQDQMDPMLQQVQGLAASRAIDGTANALTAGFKGASAAPLAGTIAPGMSQSAMLASQTAGMGATGLTAATGAGLGTAGIGAAATGGATAGGAMAGAAPAMAAMGPVGWAGLGLLGAKSMGLFKDGTTDVPDQVGGK